MVGDKQVMLGDAEIRVDAGAEVYASPTLIYHYVKDLKYLPPQQFLNALLK